MALTESTMLPIGTTAPDFTLPDTISGQSMSWSDIKDERGTVLMFICNHCPYVIHVNRELVKLSREYSAKGLGFAAISSNDANNYPADSPEKMRRVAAETGYTFPYLYDETQEVARAYDAACTPDFYVFDAADQLYYRGRLDGSRPGNDTPLTGTDLRHALDLLLSDQPAPDKQYPSAGCNIKWK